MTLVILLVRARACENDAFVLTVVEEQEVEELPAVVGVQPPQVEGQLCAGVPDRLQHGILAAIQQRGELRPAGGYVGHHQRVHELPVDMIATVGNQVRFQKPRLVFVPLGEGAHGDVVLEQGTRRRRAATVG